MFRTQHGFGLPGQKSLSWELSLLEWRTQWNNCTLGLVALGLLNGLYNANKGEGAGEMNCDLDRVLFLVELSDGHRVPHASEERSDMPDSDIQAKAFKILAGKFFAKREPQMLLYNTLRDRLFKFFANRAHDFNKKNISWDPDERASPSPADKDAARYLQFYCRHHWISLETDDEFRLKILDLLYAHQALHSLQPLGTVGRNEWSRFTPQVRAKLHELALKDADSLGESIFRGSQAGILLSLVEAVQKDVAYAA